MCNGTISSHKHVCMMGRRPRDEKSYGGGKGYIMVERYSMVCYVMLLVV